MSKPPAAMGAGSAHEMDTRVKPPAHRLPSLSNSIANGCWMSAPVKVAGLRSGFGDGGAVGINSTGANLFIQNNVVVGTARCEANHYNIFTIGAMDGGGNVGDCVAIY